MPKVLYDYVMYRLDDPMELPIRYLTIKEVCELTSKTSKSLHKQFKHLGRVIYDLYAIERFKKENENE